MDSEHLDAYLAGELDDDAVHQVKRALRNDADLRASFLHQLRIHSALGILFGADAAERSESFDEAVMARLRSEGAGGHRGFAKSVLTEIVEEREGARPLRWPDLVKAGLISAVASVALMFALQTIIFRHSGDASWLQGSGAGTGGGGFVARVEEARDLQWSESTADAVHEDGWLKNGLVRIESGRAMIAFDSGATAAVEGPAELSIESNNRVFLQSGRLVAEVPPPATGFTVNTPRLNAVDIGTRFGVSVSENGDSELHVMEGEVEASRSSGNAVATLVREGLALRADSRTRSALEPIPYAGDTFVLRVGEVTAPRPALRYTFDGSVGAVVEDSGGLRLFDVPLVADGEIDRSPRRAAGKSGGGLVFRPGQALEVVLSREFRLDTPHTLTFWIKIPPEVGRREDQTLVEYGREGRSWRVSCNLGFDRGSKGALRVDHAGGFVIGNTDIADGNWHHVACRFLGGDEADVGSHLHLFVDGRPETISDARSGGVEEGRAGRLRLGGVRDGGFEGWIDEVNLFREAIPTPIIQELSQ